MVASVTHISVADLESNQETFLCKLRVMYVRFLKHLANIRNVPAAIAL